MQSNPLFNHVLHYDGNYTYDPEAALYDAKESGLIEDFDFVDFFDSDELTWGVKRDHVFKIDYSYYIAISVYHMIGNEGPDKVQGIRHVKPREKIITVWDTSDERE